MPRKGYPSDKQDQFVVDLNCGRSAQTEDKYVARFPDGLRGRLKDAATANHRSMNSEIVARLLASFTEQDGDMTTEQHGSIRTGREDQQMKLRLPVWMHEAIKQRSDLHARSMNAEIVSIIAAAIGGEPDRLARIEAKLDRLLGDAQ